MHLPDTEADYLKELLRKLGKTIEDLVPNVKGASDVYLEGVKTLAYDASRAADSISSDYSIENRYMYSRQEMINAAIAHARLLGRESEYTWADYSKNLGLLVDFVDSKFYT